MFKGVLFDLDGVIADTSALHFQAWQKLADKYFATKLPASLEEKTKGVSRGDSLRVILAYLEVSVSESMFQQLLTEKNETYKASLKALSPENILPGITKLINDLKTHNIKLALASASLNGPAILEKLGLVEAFDSIINPNDVPHGKPAPDIFIAAAKSLKLESSECIGIEDSGAGIQAIKASGALPISVGISAELKSGCLNFPTTAELNLNDIQTAYQSLKKETL